MWIRRGRSITFGDFDKAMVTYSKWSQTSRGNPKYIVKPASMFVFRDNQLSYYRLIAELVSGFFARGKGI